MPIEHRPALQKWIAQAGPAHVAKYLTWLANYQLHYAPNLMQDTTLLYGLTAPELLHLAHDLSTLSDKA